MTSPTEIPEALKAKAREARKVLDERCEAAPDDELDAIFEDTIALALLQVRNEAIAEERAEFAKQLGGLAKASAALQAKRARP